jgi:hypothetical protein
MKANMRSQIFAGAAGLLLMAVSSSGQITSTRVLTDAGTGIGSLSIDGLELRGAGLFWWKYGANGGEFNNYQPTLGIKAGVSKYSLSLDRGGPFYMIQGGNFIAGAERDGSYAYFTSSRGGGQAGLFRQPLASAVNATPERLVGIVAPEISAGAIGRLGRNLYFAPTYAGGYTAIWGVSFNEAGEYTGAGVVAEGTLRQYAVRKLAFFNANLTGTFATWGLCLQADGSLWRFGPLNAPGLQPMVFLAGGVGDIGVRNEDGGVQVQIARDVIYATTKPLAGGPAGRLLQINPATGAATTVWTDPVGGQLLAFGFDQNFLFLSRTQPGSSSGDMVRLFLPYRWYIANPGLPPVNGWVTMETVNGINLRSDGRWLYFTWGNEVRRVSTTVAPIVLDVQAFGVEAVQIVQDFNNSVPLVAGKQVLVRGYARIAANSNSAKPTRQPTATLSMFRNGDGAGIYHPINQPTIGAVPASQLLDYRSQPTGEADTSASFDFIVPAEEVHSGTIRFTFQVNSSRSLIETGVGNPYANNTASTPVMSVVDTGVPKLICLPVQVDQRVYTLRTDPPSFWNQIGRATSLLPIPDIEVRTFGLVIQKPVARFGIPAVVYRSFDLPDNQAAAMNWIRVAIALTGIYFEGGDTHFLGMVDPGIEPGEDGKLFNGRGSRPGEVLLVRMEGANGANAWDSPLGGRTVAHELGHNYGLTHVACNVSEDTNGEYPYSPCTISLTPNTSPAAAFGWDPRSGSFIDGGTVGDLMSYNSTRWLSPYSLNRLRGLVASENDARARRPFALANAGPAAAQAGDIYLIAGMVHTAQAQAELWPAQLMPAGTYDSTAVANSIAEATLPQGHNYSVRQLDAAGTILSASPLLLARTGDGFGEQSGFVQFLEAVPGAAALQIALDETVLAHLSASGTAPAVTADAPIHHPDTHLLQWTWTASDADGDALFSSVLLSVNGGVNWQPVELFSGGSSLSLDTRNLPGGSECLLRVVVTDGMNAAQVASDPFSLPTHAPEVTIVGLTEGEKMLFGAPKNLEAFAMDAEEGSVPRSSIWWVLEGPEPATRGGRTLSLAELPPGTYSATAFAIDAASETGSATRTFEVLPISIPEAAAPAIDGEVDDAQYASTPRVRWAYGGGSGRVSARLTRAGGRLYLGFSDLPYRASGSTRAVVGIRIDVDASADAAVQSTDLGFFVDEDGRPVQREGDGATMVLRPSPASGFDSAINSGELSWTAEFCLPEAILGGAEHGIRILLTMELTDAGGNRQTFGWPATANPDSPATWAPVQLGPLPTPANTAPVALAGGDRLVAPVEDMTIFLDGSGSRDPEGQALTYQWTQVEGDPVSLLDSSTAHPSFSLSPVAETSVRRFELVVNDGELDGAPAAVSVTATPAAPTSPPREVPRFTRYPDGTVEGYFSPDDFAPVPGGDSGPLSIGSQGLYNIETSEDLLTWSPGFDVSPDLLTRLIFKDAAAVDLPYRFYRARRQGAGGDLAPGHALRFDGAARSVQVPHTPAFNAYPLTVSAWINTADTTARVGGIVSKYADSSLNGWAMFTYAGNVRAFCFANPTAYIWDGGLGLDAGFIADGAWHHVVMVIGPAGGTLYVDGIARNSRSWVGTPGVCSTAQPLQIGRYFTYPYGFTGEIDEVSVWSRELAGLQVLELYRRGPAGTEASLEGLWKLDDASGLQAVDSSAHADGTLLGNPEWVPSTAPVRR